MFLHKPFFFKREGYVVDPILVTIVKLHPGKFKKTSWDNFKYPPVTKSYSGTRPRLSGLVLPQ